MNRGRVRIEDGQKRVRVVELLSPSEHTERSPSRGAVEISTGSWTARWRRFWLWELPSSSKRR